MRHRRGVVVLRQRHDWDCGVAALAMLLGVPYGDVAALVRDLIALDVVCHRQVRRRGLGIIDIQIIADGFGRALRPINRSRDYLRGRTGIVALLGGEMDAAGHWVVLKAGTIVDPDGAEVWAVEDYLSRFKCRPATLLVEEA